MYFLGCDQHGRATNARSRYKSADSLSYKYNSIHVFEYKKQWVLEFGEDRQTDCILSRLQVAHPNNRWDNFCHVYMYVIEILLACSL